jgi:hypothetical protein
MLRKVGRLFVIKTRIEAFLIIYALATTGAVFMAGAKILDCLKYEKADKERRDIEAF